MFNDVEVGAGATVRRAILDKNVRVPEGATIGVDDDVDRARFVISPGGVVVVGKAQKVQ
jgi:glucose-1-phosphate adenylyltransferase